MGPHASVRRLAPFLALAAGSLALDAAPHVPWAAGLVCAGFFATAGVVRRFQLAGAQRAARRIADHRILRGRGTPARRAEELVAPRARTVRRREVERILRASSAARLQSASPLNRVAVRRSEPLLRLLADRLGDGAPVSARGMLYVDQLLRDPSSPLYAEHDELLPRAVARVLGALDA